MVSAIFKSYGLENGGFFRSVSRVKKKKPDGFAELFSLVRETGLDSRGSTPLGQRRSQAPPGLDSLRLLQVRFPVCKKEAQHFCRAFFFGAVDKTKSESKLSASVTCFSMNFTRWSSEK